MYAPTTLQVRNETLISNQIPASFNKVKIAVISDVNGDIPLLRQAIQVAKNQEVDALIMLGNLFNENPNEEEIKAYTEILQDINPVLGKYATYSQSDYNQNIDVLNTIYRNTGVYTLANKNLKFHNFTEEYINVVGLESTFKSEDNVDLYFPEINKDVYTITFIHDPSITQNITSDYTDVIVSGKTLGGKVSIPLIGSFEEDYTATAPRIDDKGQTHINHQGLGVTGDVVRFNTQAEIVILNLEHKDAN